MSVNPEQQMGCPWGQKCTESACPGVGRLVVDQVTNGPARPDNRVGALTGYDGLTVCLSNKRESVDRGEVLYAAANRIRGDRAVVAALAARRVSNVSLRLESADSSAYFFHFYLSLVLRAHRSQVRLFGQ
jgi:hypothetical protein